MTVAKMNRNRKWAIGLRSFLAAAFVCAAGLSAAEDARPTEIPFELVQNQIVVSARLNGKGPFLVTIDTGADNSMIDIGAALKIGMTVNPAGEEIEGGETEEGTVYDTRFTVVEIGDISARDVDALAGGMVAKLAKRLGKPVVGTLGNGFLAGRIAQFDFPRRVIRFLPDPPPDQPVSARRAVLKFKDDEAILVDAVSIGGQRVRGCIDTGSSGSVLITAEAARKLGLEPAPAPAAAARTASGKGAPPPREGAARDVLVGTLSADSVPATILPATTGRDKKQWDAAFGNGFLRDLVVTIDYPDSKLVLEKP
jgi:predicted aspartyl protease